MILFNIETVCGINVSSNYKIEKHLKQPRNSYSSAWLPRPDEVTESV